MNRSTPGRVLSITNFRRPPKPMSIELVMPHYTVVATRSGNKLTQKDNADSGVQFITPLGPRQSLLLA